MAYKCNNCGYVSPKFFGLCPKCHEGMGEEVADIPSSRGGSGGSGGNIKIQFHKIDPNLPPEAAFKKTPYNGLNSIISTAKGIISGQVILLGASPGVGKSTLCMSIADSDTLYISSEENYRQVNGRALRVNPESGCTIVCSTIFEEIMEAIKTSKEDLVIIDSLNSIEFGVGYITVARFANEIVNIVKQMNKACIIISQVGKTGEVSGMNAIVHMVDTVLHLERSETSSNIIATTSKNRYGEIGGVCAFEHRANGFVEIDIENVPDEKQVGSTCTTTRFGHKNMTITIESLVAQASARYGMIRTSGYNNNRVIQLVGVLSYYGKFDVSDKDIYVAVSNGLYTDDVAVELAIANSILSSLNRKAMIKSAIGEVRLNGNIINGSIDGRPINHISDLIKLYGGMKNV